MNKILALVMIISNSVWADDYHVTYLDAGSSEYSMQKASTITEAKQIEDQLEEQGKLDISISLVLVEFAHTELIEVVSVPLEKWHYELEYLVPVVNGWDTRYEYWEALDGKVDPDDWVKIQEFVKTEIYANGFIVPDPCLKFTQEEKAESRPVDIIFALPNE